MDEHEIIQSIERFRQLVLSGAAMFIIWACMQLVTRINAQPVKRKGNGKDY